MEFRLTHPDNVRLFETEECAREVIPTEDSTFNYRALYSKKANCWILAQYRGGNLMGYLEKENA